MNQIALLLNGLIERKLRLVASIFVLSLAAMFYGWGATWQTFAIAFSAVVLFAIFAFVSWFWLRFFRAVANAPEVDNARN